MRIVRLQNVNEVAKEVHKRMETLAKAHILCAFLPAGGSPRPLFKIMQAHKAFWQNRILPIQVDEFCDGQRPFYKQLDSELFHPIGISNAILWNIYATPTEIKNHIADTLSRQIHLAVLGLGPNGHVGFHEPGLPSNFQGGEVVVSEETRLRIPGIATNRAVTFGVASFLRAEEIIMIVCGREKANILERLERSLPDPSLPASLLKVHPNFTIYTDLLTSSESNT